MTNKVTMPEPFMYGIMEPDGTPYFGELCVSGNKGDLDDDICDLNNGNEAGLYQEVALITTTQAEAYADARVAESHQWHSIETAPHETLVVLGWYDENGVFKQEIALASAGRRYPGGSSDMWWHGRATHWMPLPPPPLPEPM